MYCAILSVQCALFSVKCAMFSVQCAMFSVQCAMFSVQCLHITLFYPGSRLQWLGRIKDDTIFISIYANTNIYLNSSFKLNRLIS